MNRPVQVDFSVTEARAVAAALDLAAAISECCEDREDATDLRVLRDRLRNGAEIGSLEEQWRV